MVLYRNEKGFTLVEVLVALAVTALMLTAVYQTVSSAANAREKLAVENARHHAARIIFERIGRELQSLHFVADDERTRFSGGIGGGDGLRVALGPAGLDDGPHPGIGRHLDAIWLGEEGV